MAKRGKSNRSRKRLTRTGKVTMTRPKMVNYIKRVAEVTGEKPAEVKKHYQRLIGESFSFKKLGRAAGLTALSLFKRKKD